MNARVELALEVFGWVASAGAAVDAVLGTVPPAAVLVVAVGGLVVHERVTKRRARRAAARAAEEQARPRVVRPDHAAFEARLLEEMGATDGPPPVELRSTESEVSAAECRELWPDAPRWPEAPSWGEEPDVGPAGGSGGAR
ncbi:hypothetical protein GCM10027160_24110 [Streptomyces calidiresistens]|uniref:Uncharacterized protein n=1 Tax=Streptomyces calidiresistens TaxID=1485586 RepID=A0A7W3XX13_9ACTN|nr:hypothetical protein [Streptomyces calidiresistens]MBB0230630.1 hypothetical protein [Streptomyces calidiresistens]